MTFRSLGRSLGRSPVRFLGPIAATALTIALIAAAASAHHSDLADPNDTRGALDVRMVKLQHVGETAFTVLTFSRWTVRSMWDIGNVVVFLDTKHGEAPEYYVLVRSTGTAMRGALYRRAAGADRRIAHVGVTRKSGDGVSVRVPVYLLDFGAKRTSYRWYVTTLFAGPHCRATCIDRIPGDGSVEQWRPGMSPTPSPTGSVSASLAP